MMRWLLLSCFVLLDWPAEAGHQLCLKHEDAAKILAEKYNEHLIAGGLQNDGVMLLVYASEDGSTFTIISRPPRGPSCLVSAGKNWGLLEVDDDDDDL